MLTGVVAGNPYTTAFTEELSGCGGSWYDPERIYREQLPTLVTRKLSTEFDGFYNSGRVGERSDLIDFAIGQRRAP
jgi:hypothetical protein